MTNKVKEFKVRRGTSGTFYVEGFSGTVWKEGSRSACYRWISSLDCETRALWKERELVEAYQREKAIEKKLALIWANMEDIANAWSKAPATWNTWVSVDLEKEEAYTSYQTTSTSPHPNNDAYVVSLPFLHEVPDECDDGHGNFNPDDLYDDVMKKCREALQG